MNRLMRRRRRFFEKLARERESFFSRRLITIQNRILVGVGEHFVPPHINEIRVLNSLHDCIKIRKKQGSYAFFDMSLVYVRER